MSHSLDRLNPLHAILRPPELEAFVKRFGLVVDDLEPNFDGWHKRAIITSTRVFLFPRYESDIALVEREAVALAALADLEMVPSLISLHREPEISSFPFLETERRFGTNYSEIEDDLSLEQVGDVLEQIGAATARWHETDVTRLSGTLHEVPYADPRWWTDALDRDLLRKHVEDAYETIASMVPSDIAPESSWVDVWEALLEPLASLEPVLTHGDVHETQLLVDGELRLEAVIDWDHACVANPVRDFNFGEWGYGIFTWEERFDILYERYWESYRAARSVALPDHRSLLLYRALGDAMWACEQLASTPDSWWHAHRLRWCAEHIGAISIDADR